ncbi:hypothetical protein PV328_000654 [Microctonus aethiopoides]|uniref:Cyclin-dependent kinase inhibitor domain-containing protein n=1 Tax=Microctonus aethiopoides TaxID=144406 RepID=A0AA39KWN7_9HYME|nr:hypothetical protein PV328_000654 [Microctonus aethiopoides]
MSARVMNPALMTEMGRNLVSGNGNSGGGRIAPSRAALARVRRDLFGPVDHAAARALAERELKAQSILDAERWGFDFHLEIPKNNSRYDWEIIGPEEIIPEPYALRGMPYLRKHSPSTPRKNNEQASSSSLRRSTSLSPMITNNSRPIVGTKVERTPPQDTRVPEIDGETTTSDVDFIVGTCRKKHCIIEEPKTPNLPITARKQTSITDFMQSRKRSLSSNTKKKSIVEPPEKISRNAGQIRS